jgi:hypothetical protein
MNFGKTIWNFTIHNNINNLACQVFKLIKILYKGNATKKNSPFEYIKYTSGTRDLRTPMATALQPPRTLCLVAIIRNFPKLTLVGPTLRHLYPHR